MEIELIIVIVMQALQFFAAVIYAIIKAVQPGSKGGEKITTEEWLLIAFEGIDRLAGLLTGKIGNPTVADDPP